MIILPEIIFNKQSYIQVIENYEAIKQSVSSLEEHKKDLQKEIIKL